MHDNIHEYIFIDTTPGIKHICNQAYHTATKSSDIYEVIHTCMCAEKYNKCMNKHKYTRLTLMRTYKQARVHRLS